MQDDFIERFIEEERYLQNEPLRIKDFIDFCSKRGVRTNEYELEFFEKEGLLYPIFCVENPKNGIPPHNYFHISFSSYERDLIQNLLQENKIFDISKLNSLYFDLLDDSKELKKKINKYYSSFQIHWLVLLKNNYIINVDLAGDKLHVSSTLERLNGFRSSDAFIINDFSEFDEKFKEASNSRTIFGDYVFNFENKKKELIKMHQYFEKVLGFLLSIQSIYAPYGRSSSKKIIIKNDRNWHEKRNKFDPKKELEILDFTIEEVGNLYAIFSKKTMNMLGVKRDDWIHLWKSIAWNKKDELEGDVRLGIEYLQWALMLKRFIEDYCSREILDIDEISNISPNDILKFNPPKMDQYGVLLRASRNKRYFDPEENKFYLKDKYKRLFYFANDFDLNYPPRIMVFVEGETEEEMFPIIFEWFYNKPENLGIEIVNFKGVSKLLSTSQNAEELQKWIRKLQATYHARFFESNTQDKKFSQLINNLKKIDIITSNWTSFISYNLEKWQILPFFVSDDEGDVRHFLDSGRPINFKNKNYNIPDDWKYLWGVTNDNQPFKGNNFEFANFSDEEIVLAINKVLQDEIDIKKVKDVRERLEGIKKVDDRLLEFQNKRKVVNVLFDNLFNQYENTNDDSILERPIFKLIGKILDVSDLNHLPVDRSIEIINKEYILKLLKGEQSWGDD
nr:hypothetical protein [uncultured Methanobacterium sp.]